MERWRGKVAIVTGASSGIGFVIARELLKNGVRVAAIGRKPDLLQKVEEKLASTVSGVTVGDNLKGIKCDVSNENDVISAISWIESNWGVTSILVNCAGVFISNPIMEGSAEAVTSIFSSNVFGITNCVREVIRSMKKHNTNDGHIININSICGHHVMVSPTIGTHTASKFAVTALTESLKNELALKKMPIKVTSISPGLVATEMVSNIKTLQHLPKLNADDVANCVIFALSTPPNVQISELTVEPVGELLTSFS
ncbi:hypothetical protein O3M35_007108 [Rhynocoris fuscipes]|uniref:Dehydrogenase n=1 Tax=Rhynocoris fuscipes TaxID=488301 RepID=A0AAW1DAM2_9HEMI